MSIVDAIRVVRSFTPVCKRGLSSILKENKSTYPHSNCFVMQEIAEVSVDLIIPDLFDVGRIGTISEYEIGEQDQNVSVVSVRNWIARETASSKKFLKQQEGSTQTEADNIFDGQVGENAASLLAAGKILPSFQQFIQLCGLA